MAIHDCGCLPKGTTISRDPLGWTLHVRDRETPVHYCPYCGQRLETRDGVEPDPNQLTLPLTWDDGE